MKKKIKNRLTITFALTAMLGIVSLGVIHDVQQYDKKDNFVKVERKVQPKYVSYDDEHYTITLSADELNDYTWINVNNYFIQDDEDESEYRNLILDYETEDYSYSTQDIYSSNIQIEYKYDTTTIYFNYYYDDVATNGVKWVLSINGLATPFENELNIICDSANYYNNLKSAIELDIQANQPVSQGETIIGAITSGLGLIPDLANEFLNGFSALFWNSQTSSLTTFSYFALVFLGIAITMAIVKLVLAIIRGNTGA